MRIGELLKCPIVRRTVVIKCSESRCRDYRRYHDDDGSNDERCQENHDSVHGPTIGDGDDAEYDRNEDDGSCDDPRQKANGRDSR